MKQCTLKEKIIYRVILFLKAGFRGWKNNQCKHLRYRKRNAYCAIYSHRPEFCKVYLCDKAKLYAKQTTDSKN